jgi:hypothetical protein
MKARTPLPDLDRLSRKDALIHRLLAQLEAERREAEALRRRLAEIERQSQRDETPPGRLLADLRRAGGRRRSPASSEVKVRLGRGLGFLRSKAVVGALALVGSAFVLDYAVARYQVHASEQRRLTELRLQHAAFTRLFVELEDVAYEPDGKSYRLTMAMENLNAESPLYVMLSPVRAFAQVGLVWREVPTRVPDGASSGVIELTGRHTYQTIFEPNVEDWTELMPGYMHVRFDSDLLISERSEPTDDIVERNDPYYVYLKPHGADDRSIRERMNYPGTPPVYIPMPPH